MTRTINRWASLNLGRGLSLRNRVVVPPMASATADRHGMVTEATRAHYSRLTESGAGLIMVEYTFVSVAGRSEENQLGVSSDEHIAGLADIARIIHKSGAVAGLQIVHGGGKTSRDLTGGVLLGPSSIAVPAKDRTLDIPTPMNERDIQKWRDDFLRAAGRAVSAGFDLVEIHGAHGYGFNQWLSPLTNQRTDAYGGARENRARLLKEVVQSIRSDYPQLVLGARLPGQDFVEGGLSPDEMQITAAELTRSGLDYVSVSSGLGGWRRPSNRQQEGYLVDEARLMQAAVPCPVIGVGGIESGTYIDSIVGNGTIALAAVGRAILANPAQWRKHNLGESAHVAESVS